MMSIKAHSSATRSQDGSAVSDLEFALFQRLIQEKAGIYLATSKKALLEARLAKRVRELQLDSFEAYYRFVLNDPEGAELVHLLDRVSTNATHFFREPKQFEFLQQKVLPHWLAQNGNRTGAKRIRVWSAGCSTGEEPYSIAMMLLDRLSLAAGWEIEILATDLSTQALANARAGIWPTAKIEEIPANYLKRYMLKGIGAQHGKIKAGKQIRSLIQFERLNLNDAELPVGGLFDLIFCRNVLIYFDTQCRAQVVARLLDRLMPEGFLFVGHAESLNGVTDRVSYVMPSVYAHGKDPRRMVTESASPREMESPR